MKTSELIGPALDWAVAKCEGCIGWNEAEHGPYSPRTDWAQGGPIIEQEHISIIDCDVFDFWKADKMNAQAQVVAAYGRTPLLAAMRCYVASKLGDEVDVPEELK